MKVLLTMFSLLSVGHHLSAQTLEQGAVIGGAVGAAGLGLIAAVLSQGLCDAADCSGRWRVGLGPGVVLGALGGGLLGSAVGAAGTTGRPASPNADDVVLFRASVAPGAGIAVSQSEVRSLPGVTAGVSVELGRLGAAIEAEYHGDSGWEGIGFITSVNVSAESGRWRILWRAGVGVYSWENPGYVPLDDPRFPGAVVRGRVRDSYVWPVLGFCVSVGLSNEWRLLGESRWHHRGVRHSQESFLLERSFSAFGLGVSRTL